LTPIWRFFGSDEADYAYMRDGKKLPAGVMRPRNPRTMSTKNPDSPSNIPDEPLRPGGENRPELGAGSIHYVGIKEPRVSVPILLVGLVFAVAAIFAFLHFFRT
jgi:hypothetical protein